MMRIQARLLDAREHGATATTYTRAWRHFNPNAPLGQPEEPLPNDILAPDSRDLQVELFAPTICEIGPRDESRIVGLEWRVAGGRDPITVEIDGHRFSGREGAALTHCDDLSGHRSRLTHHQAHARDANGQATADVVATYAIAEYDEPDKRLRSGATYRFYGVLMTILVGLEFDATRVSLITGVCAQLSSSGEVESNGKICEGAFTLWTMGRSVSVTIGERTGSLLDWHIDEAALEADPGVSVITLTEAERLIREFEAKLGLPPELPPARYNPAPLN